MTHDQSGSSGLKRLHWSDIAKLTLIAIYMIIVFPLVLIGAIWERIENRKAQHR